MGSENAVDDEVTSGIDGGGTVTYDGDAEKELGIVGMAIDIDEGEKELGIVVMVNDADDETSIPHGVKAI
jgi:hypothetical protein